MRLSAEEKGALVARYHAGEAVTEICADTGIARSTLYTWIKPYTTTTTGSGHVVSQQELITLKQKNQLKNSRKTKDSACSRSSNKSSNASSPNA